MSRLFGDDPPPEPAPEPRWALTVIAGAHLLAGGYGLFRAIAARFDGAWVLAALGAALLLANGVGLLRRRPFDRKLSRFLVGLMRVGGGGTLIFGAMAMREHMDGAWTVMGVGLGIALYGVLFGWVLGLCDGAFSGP